jgi:hypothetical protein
VRIAEKVVMGLDLQKRSVVVISSALQTSEQEWRIESCAMTVLAFATKLVKTLWDVRCEMLGLHICKISFLEVLRGLERRRASRKVFS